MGHGYQSSSLWSKAYIAVVQTGIDIITLLFKASFIFIEVFQIEYLNVQMRYPLNSNITWCQDCPPDTKFNAKKKFEIPKLV